MTSAHHVRVVYLCREHGRRFHALEDVWRATKGTIELLKRIELWLGMHREQLARVA